MVLQVQTDNFQHIDNKLVFEAGEVALGWQLVIGQVEGTSMFDKLT